MVEDIAGGCGPGGLGDYLVPDTLWGLSVRPACSIHDWLYHWGLTLKDKDSADRVFLNNMIRLIRSHTRWGWLKKLRLRRAKTYYHMVHTFGGPAFWKGKNKEGEEA